MCKVLKIVAVWGFGLAATLLASCTQVTVRPDSGSAVTVKPAGDGQLEVGVEGRPAKPDGKAPAAAAVDASVLEKRRAEMDGRIQQLESARAALEGELNRLGSKKAEAARMLEEADKELASRKEAAETATRKLAELQIAINEMTERHNKDAQTAKTLAEQITAAEATLAATEADRQRVEQQRDKLSADGKTLAEQVKANADRLAAMQKDLGEASKQQEAVAGQACAAEQRQAAAEAASVEAGAKAGRANVELKDIERRINEANERLAAVTREVADGEHQAQRLAAMQKGEMNQPASPTPAATPDTVAAGATRNPWPFVGIFVAVTIGAIVVVLLMVRKPAAYAFTLRNEDSRMNHPISLSTADRVDLSGAEPIKKAGARSSRGPFLTVNRKGQIVMHPMSGFPTKLSDRLVNPGETPVVKTGAVLEVTTNGQTHRFLIGPVSVAEKNPKTVVKSPVASVRPA
jgi:chemotaxis protein histidine kinase CheA